MAAVRPSAIVHAAAQASHDRAAAILSTTLDTNATGTANLLEAARQGCPEAPFVLMSTNKVYGDAPNHIPLVELGDALGLRRRTFRHGIPRNLHDRSSKHSLFGASKVAAT